MKRTTLTTLIATMLTLAAFLGTSTTAAADTGDYVAGMKDFAPSLERWAFETREQTNAALAKPELACSDAMAELALRGHSMADDLDGMLRLTPKRLVPTHRKVAGEVRVMATAAEQACADPAASAAEAAESYEAFAGPMKRIRSYLSRAGRMAR